jgi:hypothetical protein
MVARTRIGTTCTLWMDSIKALGGVAQITRVRPDAFLVDVMIGTHMLEVVAPAAATAHAWVRHQALADGWELRRQV